MTADGARPFLLHFSERIEPTAPIAHRYDTKAQISNVHVRGEWLPAVDERLDIGGSTKKTGVKQETTDED